MYLNIDLIPFSKSNSQWIVDLKVKHKAIKLLENNTRENLDVLGFGSDFFFFFSSHTTQLTGS